MAVARASCCLLLGASLTVTGLARTWTNSEGRKLEAEFVSADATTVTLKMQGKEVRYPLEKLSPADREFVIAEKSKPAAPTGERLSLKMEARLFPAAEDAFKDRDRKAVFEAFKAGAFKEISKGTPEGWLQRDDVKDVCRMYVPASYNGTVPYGLVLFINPGAGGIPAHWRALFDEMKLIVVSADNVGNDQPMIRRVQLSMDALATAEKQYKIDPKRRVVSGLSGGGHMAMLTAAMYPDYFLGAISHAAQSYLPSYSANGGHFPGMELRDFKRGDRGKLKWVVISGDKDFNYAEIQKTSGQWDEAKLPYKFINVPGMGHVNAEAGPMKEALQWVGL